MAKIVIEGWRPVRIDWKNTKPVSNDPWSQPENSKPISECIKELQDAMRKPSPAEKD